VELHQAFVRDDRLGTKARTLTDPRCYMVNEHHTSGVWVEPVAFGDLRVLTGQPQLRVLLPLECLRCRTEDTVRAWVSRRPTSRAAVLDEYVTSTALARDTVGVSSTA